MLCHPGKTKTIYNISSLVGTAFLQAFTIKNNQSGFRVTGIWLFNENLFEDVEFLWPCITDQPSPGVDLTSTSDQKPSTGTADQEPSISIADLQSNASQLLSESHQLKTVSPFDVSHFLKLAYARQLN